MRFKEKKKEGGEREGPADGNEEDNVNEPAAVRVGLMAHCFLVAFGGAVREKSASCGVSLRSHNNKNVREIGKWHI